MIAERNKQFAGSEKIDSNNADARDCWIYRSIFFERVQIRLTLNLSGCYGAWRFHYDRYSQTSLAFTVPEGLDWQQIMKTKHKVWIDEAKYGAVWLPDN